MRVTFYFDPTCPFSWVTSRWLLMVCGHRDLTVSWQPFSLALKNNEQNKQDGESSHALLHRQSLRLLRVMVAAEAQGASLIAMYTASGVKHHVAGFDINDEHIKEILKEKDLPAKLFAAADDTQYDEVLQKAIARATAIAGNDIGVPTIVFENEKGESQGFFGPVLQTLPDLNESLDLWDGLSKLATNSSFYELKRARPSGVPDVFSTAKC